MVARKGGQRCSPLPCGTIPRNGVKDMRGENAKDGVSLAARAAVVHMASVVADLFLSAFGSPGPLNKAVKLSRVTSLVSLHPYRPATAKFSR
jgi:hypothetical protein